MTDGSTKYMSVTGISDRMRVAPFLSKIRTGLVSITKTARTHHIEVKRRGEYSQYPFPYRSSGRSAQICNVSNSAVEEKEFLGISDKVHSSNLSIVRPDHERKIM